jgi:hypothetical protein
MQRKLQKYEAGNGEEEEEWMKGKEYSRNYLINLRSINFIWSALVNAVINLRFP